jgi:hypothetical protein
MLRRTACADLVEGMLVLRIADRENPRITQHVNLLACWSGTSQHGQQTHYLSELIFA